VDSAGKGGILRPVDKKKFDQNFDQMDWGRAKSAKQRAAEALESLIEELDLVEDPEAGRVPLKGRQRGSNPRAS
jgi:hypothetical protein